MDESLRSLLREAEHAHDANLWLRAAGAAARSRDYDEAGRALLWVRALGAETAPIDDAMAPSSLEHERRGVGSLLTAGPLSLMAWGPRSDTIYAVAEERRIIALGVEPGQSRRVKELPREALAIVGSVRDEEILVIVAGIGGERWAAVRLELESGRLEELESERSTQLPERAKQLEPYWMTPRRGTPFVPQPARPGAPKTLRMVFNEDDLSLSFPTRRSGERFVELATSDRVGFTGHEIRSSIACVAASPSGRHVAFAGRERVRLVDLVSGATRDVDMDGKPLDAQWSPSGRRLAVLTALRVHVFTFTE